MTSVRALSRHMFLIRAEIGFLGELDDAFLVPVLGGCVTVKIYKNKIRVT